MLLGRLYTVPTGIRQADVVNDSLSKSFSLKVKFTRESPNDFYLSGDRVQGVVQLITNENEDDLNRKYGPLHVELIGELNDFITNRNGTLYAKDIRKFFRKQAQVQRLPSDNMEINGLRSYQWAFDGFLDCTLPSSLPPDDDCDPCIFYYARVYFRDYSNASRIFAFVVFTRTPLPLVLRKSSPINEVEAIVRYKNVSLHGILMNNGLVVPGKTLTLQTEIDNPTEVIIKSMRATLKQYRRIVDQETEFIIFSFNLPGFQPQGFKSKFRRSTYELSIPLEKCRVMAPTSTLKKVRYELHIQCHISCLFNSRFILKLPVICATDHQKKLKVTNELIPQSLLDREEEKQPPSYEDFIASEILPRYEDIER